MRTMGKTLAAAVLVFASLFGTAWEIDAAWLTGGAVTGTKTGKRQEPPRRPQLSLEEMQLILSEKYRVMPEDTKRLTERGVGFRDLEKAALYSYISGESINDVLALKEKEVWTRVEYHLGITPEKFAKKNRELRANNMERWWGIPTSIGVKYMSLGYPMHYVKVAWIVSKKTKWTVDEVLASRSFKERWVDWAARELGVTPETYNHWVNEEYKNPTWIPGKYF